MDILTKQNIEKQELSIFLRDLSADVNINLKHMIEDMYKKDEKVSVKKKCKKGKGTPPMKKKDIIIQQQNEKRKIRDIEDDINRIDYFLNIIDKNDPFIDKRKNFVKKEKLSKIVKSCGVSAKIESSIKLALKKAEDADINMLGK